MSEKLKNVTVFEHDKIRKIPNESSYYLHEIANNLDERVSKRVVAKQNPRKKPPIWVA